jgi:Tol biopolymer transport system component
MVNYYEQFFSPVNSNLWYIDLTNNQANQLTMHESEFVFSPSVSPDGQQVIFNYAPNLQEDTPAELRIMSIEGGAMTTFGPSNIAYGAWGPAAGTTPTATPQPGENDVSIYLPYTVR